MQNYRNISKVLLILLFTQCQTEQDKSEVNESFHDQRFENVWLVDEKTMQGTTQGTTFTIKTSEPRLLVSPQEVSLFLKAFDMELSGYDSTSLLSRINEAEKFYELPENRFFQTCYDLSYAVFEKTDGAFDPSVLPLVKAWGFFKDMQQPPSDDEIDEILTYVGFESGLHHDWEGSKYIKFHPDFQIDFNAIAQGQSVDELADFLTLKGHKHFFIEVGGEIYAKGRNAEGTAWIIGIDEPSEENDGYGKRNIENYLAIDGRGVATSGSYRKFYEKEDKKYSHTIDPSTGRPVNHNLLSVTVVAPSAALADAYATAFMTMGVEQAMRFVEVNTDLDIDVYFLFDDDNGRLNRVFTNNMKKYFVT